MPIVLRLLCLLLLTVGLSPVVTATTTAQSMSRTALTYSYGEHFTEPANPRDVTKHTLGLSHTNTYTLGSQAFNISWIQSDENNPVAGGQHGAREIYALYRHHLALSKLTGQSLALGPLREVSLTAGFDLNTKNDAFAARKRAWRIGPTLEFAVPGFLTLGLLYQKEYNHTDLPVPRHDVAFTGIPLLALAWGMPLAPAGQSLRFEGNVEYRAAKGKDYWNRETAAETQLDVALLFDLSATGLARDQLFVGPAYQYWHNKMGNQPGIGTHTATPMLRLKWFF